MSFVCIQVEQNGILNGIDGLLGVVLIMVVLFFF